MLRDPEGSMRLLDRYLLREFLIPLAYCLGGFLVFWISFDLISELDEFQRRQLRVADIAEYYLVKSPELLVTVLPVALLLALLYALTNHARHQELTAMRAAGLSLWRLAAPYLIVGFLFSLGLFAVNEFAVPDGNEAANRVLERYQAAGAAAEESRWRQNLTFYNDRDRRKWNIAAYNRQTGEMVAPNFIWPLADGSQRWVLAGAGQWTNGVWVFEAVTNVVYLPPPSNQVPVITITNRLELPELPETPEQIRSEIKYSELSNLRLAKRPRLSLREIHDYQRLHPYLPARDAARLETQFHGRLAEPWTCLVVVLIALPFGAPSGRRNVFVGVASSIFIGFGYFVLLRTTLALGTGGYAPPWVAAWLPNLVFALVGVGLTQRVR